MTAAQLLPEEIIKEETGSWLAGIIMKKEAISGPWLLSGHKK